MGKEIKLLGTLYTPGLVIPENNVNFRQMLSLFGLIVLRAGIVNKNSSGCVEIRFYLAAKISLRQKTALQNKSLSLEQFRR